MEISKSPGVYCWLNDRNNKVYVGSSKNMQTRCKSHLHMLRKGTHPNKHWQAAWNKYGEESFSVFVIEECQCDKQILIGSEQHWIDYLQATNVKCGYNKCLKANNRLGVKESEEVCKRKSERVKAEMTEERRKLCGENLRKQWLDPEIRAKWIERLRNNKISEETRQKLAETSRGRKHTKEAKQKIADSKLGKPRSAETIEKMRQGNLGKVLSEETKRKISEYQRGKPPPSVETREKMKQSAIARRQRERLEREKRLTNAVPLVSPPPKKISFSRKKQGTICEP